MTKDSPDIEAIQKRLDGMRGHQWRGEILPNWQDRSTATMDVLASDKHKAQFRDFIVNAAPDIEWLLSQLATLRAERDRLREILHEPFVSGTRVINCVVHTGALTERPRNCENCATDIRNQLAFAIRVNEFLNDKVDRSRATMEGK